MKYVDRAQAGRALAKSLDYLRGTHPLVLGLPRGGVPVARAIADLLDGDVDILLVRKLGVPWQPELAMGAITEGGIRVVNEDVVEQTRVTREQFDEIEAAEKVELERRTATWRGARPPIPLRNRVVVITDDGVATGATAAAACMMARTQGPRRLVLAVPVGPPGALHRLGSVADEVVCPYSPDDLGGVGGVYLDFHQLEDDEVTTLLETSTAPVSDTPIHPART